MAGLAHSVQAPFREPRMRGTVAPVAGLASRPRGADDDAVLARRAAGGDGDAFAELYERHEGRVYNLCYRILGSGDDAADATQEAFVGVLRRLPKLAGDRDLAFGSYVLTSARNACYDLIERSRRAQPSDEIPDSATPVGGGVGGGGVGFDPGDPEDDPERNILLEARTEEIRAANLTLPERQREVLALRELEELSYDEIAELMDMNRNSVAQLISRARINLRDALRGTALASVAASSPDCERALPLIALEQDGQLDDDSNEAGWLGEHLMHCHTCRLGRDAVQEAGVSYRAWAPIAAGPLLFRETMARAAEHVGADWSETIARREVRRGGAAGAAGGAGGAVGSAQAAMLRHRRRDLTLIGVLACLLVLVVLVGAASDDDPVGSLVPAADEEPAAAEPAAEKPAGKPNGKKGRAKRRDREQPVAAPPPAEPELVDEPAVVVEPAPAAPEAAPKRERERPRRQVRVEGRGDRGGQGGLTPDPPPEPPPLPPPPTETTPPPPPPTEQPPPQEPPRQPPPPPSCIPSPNCPGGQPPRP
jgi:RNA polymerase sigma factor (sigma-70 family)